MNPLITIENLSVKYGNFEALKNVNIQIFNNDFLGVIGPNGGGKTTFIKTMIKAVKYTGSIYYHDAIKVGNEPSIGYLPQQNNFDKHFPISVKEVIMSGLMKEKGLWREYSKADLMKARELMAMVEIENIANNPIGEISGGQMQRALLCRAVISSPKLLILDEPANFVDNKFEKELYEILKRLNEIMAIIMVSHDIGTITSVVKNIVCINKTVHRHDSNVITTEQLINYACPLTLVSHGDVPHTILPRH